MARSNYADEPSTGGAGFFQIDHPVYDNGYRAWTPGAGPLEGHGMLAARSGGDWSWQPHRSNKDTPTYKPTLHPRACRRCFLTSCLSLIAPLARATCA